MQGYRMQPTNYFQQAPQVAEFNTPRSMDVAGEFLL